MDYIIAIKELCRYRLLKLAWGQIWSMACGTWQFGLAFRFFNCGIDENLYHDLFACDSNEFDLFGSKVSLEVPVWLPCSCVSVGTEDSKKRQVSVQENPVAQPGRTTQEDISIQVRLESTEDEYTGKCMKQVSIEDYKYTGKSDMQIQDIESVHRNLAPGVARGYAPGHKKICIFPQATP
ncbi:hypothetical protein T06_6845 [Trichinella sp. T6]|nr:hypothetical protein T06_6845 [Trichinella sp. T6]